MAGWDLLGHRYGLACDRLRAAQVVLADGRVVCCDDRAHVDLFWALRGGGAGGFGIVTELVFDTVAEPATACFRVRWPFECATAVIAAWQRWAPTAPRELTANLTLTASSSRRRWPRSPHHRTGARRPATDRPHAHPRHRRTP